MWTFLTGDNRAFTLTEVVLVTAILAIGLLTFTAALPYSATVRQESERESKIAMLAQQMLETVHAKGFSDLHHTYPETASGTGEATGVFPDHPTISWRLKWQNMDIPGLRKIELAVQNTKQQKLSRLEIVTYLAARE